jgi:hypothetical protein
MSPRSKREYLAAIVKRYRAASRKIKTAILNEFCSTYGYHRKHALRLPFPILGFDADNGSEFLNHHLFRYLTENRVRPVQFTRSRAYKKDDNAHIEQKNWTHVRQWLGYDRLDSPEVVPLMNELYTTEWRLFLNFFCPSVKLLEKKRVTGESWNLPMSPMKQSVEKLKKIFKP